MRPIDLTPALQSEYAQLVASYPDDRPTALFDECWKFEFRNNLNGKPPIFWTNDTFADWIVAHWGDELGESLEISGYDQQELNSRLESKYPGDWTDNYEPMSGAERREWVHDQLEPVYRELWADVELAAIDIRVVCDLVEARISR